MSNLQNTRSPRNDETKEIYAWDVATRIFHWLLAIALVTALLSGFHTPALNLHIVAGTFALALAVYRIFRGLWSRNFLVRFSSFSLSLGDLFLYFKEALFNKMPSTPFYKRSGHNPASSFTVITMLVLLVLLPLSGTLLLGAVESKGVAAFLKPFLFAHISLLHAAHKILSIVFILLIVFHIAGVFTEHAHRKNKIAFAMFSGRKTVAPAQREGHPAGTLALGALLLLPIFSLWFWSASQTPNYSAEVPDYVKSECDSCHFAYTANILPAQSWQNIMDTLDDHFGEDASIDEESRTKILQYMLKNSAEQSLSKTSYFILKSPEKKSELIAFSQSQVWQHIHSDIDEKEFEREEILSQANCLACHKDAEQGVYSAAKIHRP